MRADVRQICFPKAEGKLESVNLAFSIHYYYIRAEIVPTIDNPSLGQRQSAARFHEGSISD